MNSIHEFSCSAEYHKHLADPASVRRSGGGIVFPVPGSSICLILDLGSYLGRTLRRRAAASAVALITGMIRMADGGYSEMAPRCPSPAISVIIPVYQEENAIAGLLKNLCDLGADEIIVVDGGSVDRTAEIAAHYARVIVTSPSRGIQMNAGAAAAKGDVLLFLHADVLLGPGALEEIRNVLVDPGFAGGNFDILFEGGDTAAHIFTIINRWRCRCGIFYGDSGIFCRREIFDQLGGYRAWPILEDYDFGQRLRKTGNLKLLSEPIRVSDRRWRSGGLWRTLWNWLLIQGLYLAGVSPHRLARLYRHVR